MLCYLTHAGRSSSRTTGWSSPRIIALAERCDSYNTLSRPQETAAKRPWQNITGGEESRIIWHDMMCAMRFVRTTEPDSLRQEVRCLGRDHWWCHWTVGCRVTGTWVRSRPWWISGAGHVAKQYTNSEWDWLLTHYLHFKLDNGLIR